MTEGRPNGYVSLGKFRVCEQEVWLSVGMLCYDASHHAALLKPDWSAILPLCRRHEGEPELRAFCKPYDNLTDLPFIDGWLVQFAKSSKNKKVVGKVYTRQCAAGGTSYDLVMDVQMVLRLLDKPFLHLHNPDRDEKETA